MPVAIPAHAACTAVSLDENGKPLTYARALPGPDGTLWMEAIIKEFDRVIDKAESMQFIPADAKPADRFDNAHVRIKLLLEL
jgi:hypothetical protein